MTKIKRLWLLLWEQCNRTCEYCCNKQNDLSNLRTARNLFEYDSIILTGGEPLVKGMDVLGIIDDVRKNMRKDARLYMYTAKTDNIDLFCMALDKLDGATITLHTQKDAENFRRLIAVASHVFEGKSMRLKVFRNVRHPGDLPPQFRLIDNIVPLAKCPVPDGDFMRYEPGMLFSSTVIGKLVDGITERSNTYLYSEHEGNVVLFSRFDDNQVLQISHEPYNYPTISASIVHMSDYELRRHIIDDYSGWLIVKSAVGSPLPTDEGGYIEDTEDM